MMHSSTLDASMPARATAPRTASAPSNFPVGVRTALMMTASRISLHMQLADRLRSEQPVQFVQDDAGRSLQLALPALVGGLHFHGPVGAKPRRRDAAQRIADRHAPRGIQLSLRHWPLP